MFLHCRTRADTHSSMPWPALCSLIFVSTRLYWQKSELIKDIGNCRCRDARGGPSH